MVSTGDFSNRSLSIELNCDGYSENWKMRAADLMTLEEL
jgi:hypothetical protein